jgi:hypothetical protein
MDGHECGRAPGQCHYLPPRRVRASGGHARVLANVVRLCGTQGDSLGSGHQCFHFLSKRHSVSWSLGRQGLPRDARRRRGRCQCALAQNRVPKARRNAGSRPTDLLPHDRAFPVSAAPFGKTGTRRPARRGPHGVESSDGRHRVRSGLSVLGRRDGNADRRRPVLRSRNRTRGGQSHGLRLDWDRSVCETLPLGAVAQPALSLRRSPWRTSKWAVRRDAEGGSNQVDGSHAKARLGHYREREEQEGIANPKCSGPGPRWRDRRPNTRDLHARALIFPLEVAARSASDCWLARNGSFTRSPPLEERNDPPAGRSRRSWPSTSTPQGVRWRSTLQVWFWPRRREPPQAHPRVGRRRASDRRTSLESCDTLDQVHCGRRSGQKQKRSARARLVAES